MPGQFIEYDGGLHEILYVYRLNSAPHEWVFCLEERSDTSGRLDDIGYIAASLGCGDQTPRIVYDIFRDQAQVMRYFLDIPGNGDRIHLRTRTLLNHGRLVDAEKTTTKPG